MSVPVQVPRRVGRHEGTRAVGAEPQLALRDGAGAHALPPQLLDHVPVPHYIYVYQTDKKPGQMSLY
jgi:hypothetical protein